jgi:DNA-binding NarL/FixJ family response regulator
MTARVLLVDDERDTRDMLARALGRAGYECVLAADAPQAMKAITSDERVDVVVTDVVMGLDDRSGLRLVSELRQRGLQMPIVVITAYADMEKVKCALNEGADFLLEKPFRAAELISALQRVCANASAAPAIDALFERVALTDKERTVARHLLAGLSSNEIANLEKNSPKTIRQHVSQIYAKCQVSSRAEFFRLVYAR